MSSVSSPATSSTSPTSLPSAASTFQPARIISHETGSPTSTVLPLALLTAALARTGPQLGRAQYGLNKRGSVSRFRQTRQPQPWARSVLPLRTIDRPGLLSEQRERGYARSGVDDGLSDDESDLFDGLNDERVAQAGSLAAARLPSLATKLHPAFRLTDRNGRPV